MPPVRTDHEGLDHATVYPKRQSPVTDLQKDLDHTVERQRRAEYEVVVTGPDQFGAAVAQDLDKCRELTDTLGPADVEPAAQLHVPPSQSVPLGATAASASGVRAWFDFQPPAPGELRLRTTDVTVLKPADRGGGTGSPRNPIGRSPPSHVKTLPKQSQDAVRQDAQEE